MVDHGNVDSNDLGIDVDLFKVLINAEGQYSLWPAGKEIPDGWSSIGPLGTKPDCLAFVESNWTDMR